ncbi:hypothetical protein HY061_00145 [Candidatus Azambacteria bacterium]|nr:hypothetical protein [Candidatus Azambacteria bacterium]
MMPENPNQNQNFPRPSRASQPPRPPQPPIEDRLFQAKGVRLMENDIKEVTHSNDFDHELNDEQPLPENKFELLDDDEIDVLESSDHSNVKIITVTSIVVISLLLVVSGIYIWVSSNTKKLASNQSRETSFMEPEKETEPSVIEPINPIPTVEPPAVEPVPVIIPVPVVAPTPEPVVAPVPTSLIKGINDIKISIDTKEKNTIVEALNVIKDDLDFGETRHLVIETTGVKKEFLSFEDFLTIFDIELPEEISKKAVNWSVYLYQPQKREIDFCKRMNINKSGCGGFRLSLVLDANSLGDFELGTKNFEKEIAPSLSGLILAKISKPQYSFSNATYKKLKLRYKNYPILPSKRTTSITSIDYVNYKKLGNNFLVISTSRLSFYALLDKLNSAKTGSEDNETEVMTSKKEQSTQVDKLPVNNKKTEEIAEQNISNLITISGVKVKSATSDSITLNFSTSILAYGSSQLAFTSLKIKNQICGDGSIEVEAKPSLLHEVVIKGLCPETDYELIPFAYLSIDPVQQEKTRVFGERIKVRTSK